MKKTVIIIATIIMILSINKKEYIEIPKEAIRFRVIANSNTEMDQNVKKDIVKNLTEELQKTKSFENIEETRNYIKRDLPTFEKIVNNTLEYNKMEETFHINYGKNYFPEKKYKNILYKAGEYESLVVTIGKGEGENFWCVLFPPLCFIDEDNIEYKSFIKEVIDKYF